MFIADHGMEVEQEVVDLMAGEQYQSAFAAINPNNVVPVLEDGGFRLTECSAILKYLADVVDSPTYPKELQARARVNSAMDWVNTGFYRAFGYNLCYPQVLPRLKWPDATAQLLALAAGQAGSRKLLGVMNDHMLGVSNPWLCGDSLSIADYFASGILSLGKLTGCNFSAWANVQHWYDRIQAMPNWESANAALYAWANQGSGLRASIRQANEKHRLDLCCNRCVMVAPRHDPRHHNGGHQ
jgi:glutathione S-transferase